ncbi:MAG TPA: J domain-containing protein [Xanthobacteraceae bacterium]|nr:J domain-containing protein [Xanthobacteraceae bacterium]
MRDPYEVLGVAKGANAAAIKSAFRKQAKKLHPDANRQDPKAASRFAELNAAYEILGDEDKRKAFDRGEIDAEGKPRFQGFAGAGAQPGGFGREGFENFTWSTDGFQRRAGRGARGGGGFEDILKDVFGSMGGGRRGRGAAGMEFEPEDFGPPPRGADISADLTITLPEAVKGGTKRLRLSNGKELDVKIPAGLTDGQTIRLKGQGMPAPDGTSGDLLIRVSIAPHPLFKLDGTDLRLELPITVYEAELGGKVRVPTLDGAVELTIPPRTNSGRTFRLKGKGIAAKQETGDLLVTVEIVLPDRHDSEFEQLMRQWRDGKPYNPRKDIE